MENKNNENHCKCTGCKDQSENFWEHLSSNGWFWIICVIGLVFLLCSIAKYFAAINAEKMGLVSGNNGENMVISDNQAAETQIGLGKTIVIDPGHGGIDGGKVGVNDALEKDINLEISFRLKACLENYGFKVVLTREEDVCLSEENATNKKMQDMKKRIEIIEKAKPELVVSIHQNSYPKESVSGAQIFYYEGSEESSRLAKSIQDAIVTQIQPENQRGIKANDNYYMLKKTPGTIVIAECGFLSCPEEAALLIQEDYQQRIAEAIAQGVIDFCTDSAYNKMD